MEGGVRGREINFDNRNRHQRMPFPPYLDVKALESPQIGGMDNKNTYFVQYYELINMRSTRKSTQVIRIGRRGRGGGAGEGGVGGPVWRRGQSARETLN